MSVTTSNFHFGNTGWCSRTTSMMLMASNEGAPSGTSPNVDDGLTSLSWLQNLNMCMTRLGAPTPPTPPASPVCSSNGSANSLPNNSKSINNKSIVCAAVDTFHTNIHKIQTTFNSYKEGRNHSNGSSNASKQKTIQTTETERVDYKTNGSVKPPYSYATLICMAMKANKNKMTLSAIYKWIRENFLYYKNADPSWQNSIRHNLSLNKCFIKIPRNKDEPGKGGFWRLDPVYADTLVDGVFKKRRPSQRGSNSGSNTPLRKKSRKKDNLRNGCPQSSSLSEVKSLVSNGTDSTLIHDTPPNSTESYTIYGEANDVSVELVTAVNSIEGVGSVGHCSSYSYTMQGSQSESHLSHPGYGNEICITESAPEGTCILETDGGDICWNAILTDADLNELTNFTGPVIQTADSSLTVSDSNTTTAQLTAVEPHSLHLVANVANGVITPTNGVIEESELFHNRITRHINCLAIRPAIGSDVISATHNVVTCVNPTTVNTTDWNHWQTFSTVATHDNQSTDLLIRHINTNCEPIVSTSPPIAYTTTTTAVNSRPVPALKQNSCVSSQQNSSSETSTQPSSPTSANFEHNNPLQPWAECKAALEAAALDLENFGTLDVVHHY